jgi:hypothetical protein
MKTNYHRSGMKYCFPRFNQFAGILLVLFFASTFFLTACKTSLASQEDGVQKDAFLAILAMNYCHLSLAKIISYNDRIILDEEYNNIINNIKLSKIKDREVMSIITSLMDTLTKFKLDERSKEKLNNIYEKKVEKALYSVAANGSVDAFKSGKTAVTSALSTAAAIGGAAGGSTLMAGPASIPIALAASGAALVSIGNAYRNYRNITEEYRKELGEQVWQLETSAISEINEINKKFIEVYWQLLNKYDAPDEWRLSLAQLNDYIKLSKDEDPARQHRRLVQAEHELQFFPPYWYYRSAAAYASGNDEDSLHSFNKLTEVRKAFFRKDFLFSSALMIKVQLTDYTDNQDALVADLQEILHNSCKDRRKNIFVALTYQKYGFLEKAYDIIQDNIDNDWNISICSRIKAEIIAEKSGSDAVETLIKKYLADDQIRNQDIMFMLGRISDQDFLNSISEQIFNISIKGTNSFYGADDIILNLPMKWIVDDEENINIKMEVADKTLLPGKIDFNPQDKQILLLFKDAVDLDAFLKEDNMSDQTISFHLNTIAGEVIFRARIQVISLVEGKNTLDKGVDYTKKISRKGKNLIDSIVHKNKQNPESKDIDVSTKKDKKKVQISIEQIVYGSQCYQLAKNVLRKCQ